MRTVEELVAQMKELKAEDGKDVLNKLHDAMLLMNLSLDPRNKFGGEYERMSKIISMSNVLYWYLVIVAREGVEVDQLLRLVSGQVDKTEQKGPEIKVMPPVVKNEDNT